MIDFFKKLYRVLFAWNFPAASDEELRTADAIVTQSYEVVKDGNPGNGNRVMAKVARELHEKFGLPIMAQEELLAADPELPVEHIARDPSKTGESTAAWNTYEVAKVQEQYCRRNGWRKVVVIAVPDHMGRSVWVYQKLGLTTLIAPMPATGYTGSEHSCVSHRVAWLFRIREVLVRLLFWYWGYI